MRTVPDISDLLKPIDDIILTEFIPAITGGKCVNSNGGLGLPIFSEICNSEYANSLLLTSHLTNNIVRQEYHYTVDDDLGKKGVKSKVQSVNATGPC